MWTTLAQFFSAKREEEKGMGVRRMDGHVEHVYKFPGLSVKTGVDIWTFVRINDKRYVIPSFILVIM